MSPRRQGITMQWSEVSEACFAVEKCSWTLSAVLHSAAAGDLRDTLANVARLCTALLDLCFVTLLGELSGRDVVLVHASSNDKQEEQMSSLLESCMRSYVAFGQCERAETLCRQKLSKPALETILRSASPSPLANTTTPMMMVSAAGSFAILRSSADFDAKLRECLQFFTKCVKLRIRLIVFFCFVFSWLICPEFRPCCDAVANIGAVEQLDFAASGFLSEVHRILTTEFSSLFVARIANVFSQVWLLFFC